MLNIDHAETMADAVLALLC